MEIFYKAQRIGQFGKPFTMYKFRTMVKNADKIGGSSTSDDDPRITRLGKFLRKTKLDELPQFINVFKGDMNLIGWRPEALEYLNTFRSEILETKPGIIGLATLWDSDEGAMLAGSLDPDREYVDNILPKKRELEYYYVINKSIWLDLQIVLGFIKKLLHVRPTKTGDPSKIESFRNGL
jgi:lipopolysaccharide/colanic/teichoic acid biosynthesis glycosyltransferase